MTYLAFEFPTGYLMQRLPTAKYLGANVILWGLMTALVSTAKNWAGLVILRVLLGCFEAVVAPALVSQVHQHAPIPPSPGMQDSLQQYARGRRRSMLLLERGG